jgi:hypothetical protein
MRFQSNTQAGYPLKIINFLLRREKENPTYRICQSVACVYVCKALNNAVMLFPSLVPLEMLSLEHKILFLSFDTALHISERH